MQFRSITKSSGRCKAVPIPGQISGDTFSVPVARRYPPVIYHTLSYYTMQYIYIHDCTILHCTMLEYSIYYTILYHIISYYTLLYRTVPHYTILYNIALYRTMLYGSVLYYIILYWLIIYYTRRPVQSIERVRTPIDSSIFNLLNHPCCQAYSADLVKAPSVLPMSYAHPQRMENRTLNTIPSFNNSFTLVPRSCSVSYKTAPVFNLP